MDFAFELYRGHVIALAGDQRLLVDTGSPTSFGRPGPLAEPGRELLESPFGDDIDSIAADVGTRLDGLVGMDLVARHGGLTLHWREGRLRFGPATTDGAVIAAGRWRRATPRLVTRLAESAVAADVDTGAFVSYATPELLDGVPATGEVEDFHPHFGRFATSLHQLPLAIGGVARTHDFALAPPDVALMLTAYDAVAIIGTDVLRTFASVAFDPTHETVLFERD